MPQATSLFSSLTLESDQFHVALRKAGKAAVDEVGKIQGQLSGLRNGLQAVAGALALDAFAGAAKRALDFSDAIADLADRTGASTKMIQELRYAAQLSGSSIQSADAAVDRFAKNLGAAQNGNKAMAKTFAELGVTSRDVDGALRETMDGIARLGTTAERNSKTIQIFGKSAGDLTVVMSGGTEGFDKLAQAARELGVVIDERVIRQSGEANDKLDQMKMILDAQFAAAIVENAQAIVNLANGLIEVGRFAGNAIKGIRDFANEVRLARAASEGWTFGIPNVGDSGRRGRAAYFGMSVGDTPLDQDNMDIAYRRQQARAAATAARNVARGRNRGPLSLTPAAAMDAVRREQQLLAEAIARSRSRGAPPPPAGDLPALTTGGGSGGGRKSGGRAGASGGSSRSGAGDFARELQAVLDRADPAAAEFKRFAADVATLDEALRKGAIGADQHAAAINALREGLTGIDKEARGYVDEILQSADRIETRIADQSKSVYDTVLDYSDGVFREWDRIGQANRDLEQSFEQSMRGIESSVQRLGSALQGGSFLDILGSLLELGLDLGGAGVFGKSAAARINGARALGGPVMAGGRYLVGERGPELVDFGRSGTVIPNDQLGGRGGVVQLVVDEGALFRPTIRQVSGEVTVEVVSGAEAQRARVARMTKR